LEYRDKIKMKKTKSTTKLPRSIKRMFPEVKTVSDAKEAVEITVNRKDCKIAQKRNPTECALAKAAKRELKVDKVIIGISSSYLIKGTEAIRFQTPQSVQREIVSFDRHQDFAEGSYNLVPKSGNNRMGQYIDTRTNKKGGKYKYAKRKIHHSARVRVLPSGAE